MTPIEIIHEATEELRTKQDEFDVEVRGICSDLNQNKISTRGACDLMLLARAKFEEAIAKWKERTANL
jgi:hypothetical protein